MLVESGGGGSCTGDFVVPVKGAAELGALLLAEGGEFGVGEELVGVGEVVEALRVADDVHRGGHGGR